MKNRVVVLALVLCVFCACSKSEPGKVKVEGGWIQGTVTDGLAVYKGIPFAAPPVICIGKHRSPYRNGRA